MRVIKDNSTKELIVKCRNCTSSIAYTVNEMRIKWGTGKRFIVCPCCKEDITVHRPHTSFRCTY